MEQYILWKFVATILFLILILFLFLLFNTNNPKSSVNYYTSLNRQRNAGQEHATPAPSLSRKELHPFQWFESRWSYWFWAPFWSGGLARTRSLGTGAVSLTRESECKPSSGPDLSPSMATPTIGRTLMASNSLFFLLWTRMRIKSIKVEKWPLRYVSIKKSLFELQVFVGFPMCTEMLKLVTNWCILWIQC